MRRHSKFILKKTKIIKTYVFLSDLRKLLFVLHRGNAAGNAVVFKVMVQIGSK